MTLIRKPNQIQVRGKLKMLIYGQAGQGKTTMGVSAPKPLLIDCDNGTHRINPMHIVDTVQVESYKDVLDVLREDLSAYESIVIDTGGKLLDFMSAHIIANNPKLGRANGALTLQGYGERKGEFSQFCKSVGALGKHLVFIAHRETRTEGEETRYVPMFGGSSYDTLVTELDLVGYLEATGKIPTITFMGTSRNDGKNTCNLPPVIEVPSVVDAQGNGLKNDFLERVVFGAYNKQLERLQKLGAEYSELMDDLKTQVELITDEQSANDFISRIDEFNHIGASKLQAAQLLMEKCKQLGLVLNKKTKKYEPAA